MSLPPNATMRSPPSTTPFSFQTLSPTDEKMRRCFTVSLLSIAISVLLLRSFYIHISRDIFPYAALHGHDAIPPPPPAVVASLNATLFHRHNLAISELPPTPSRRSHPPLPLSILFPDWDAFLLLPLPSAAGDHHNLSCLFHNGAVSPAGFIGILPTSPSCSAFRCPIPTSIRRRCPFCTPRLIDPTTAAPESDGHDPHSKMIRWTRLAYEVISTPNNVIVFAKGVNSFQRVNHPTFDLRCLFSSSTRGVTTPIAATPVTSSTQEVFRCLHPPATTIPSKSRTGEALHISLQIAEGRHVTAFVYAPLQQNSSFLNASHALWHASPTLSSVGHCWLRSTTHPIVFGGSDVRQGFRQRGEQEGVKWLT